MGSCRYSEGGESSQDLQIVVHCTITVTVRELRALQTLHGELPSTNMATVREQ